MKHGDLGTRRRAELLTHRPQSLSMKVAKAQHPDGLESWRGQTWPVRILRAFLGGTFLYAGMQKLADPHFLHSGTPDFIGSQLQNFERGSPIHGLLAPFARFPAFTGLGIALLEIAIGLGTLLGVAAVTFAAFGVMVNLILFLSATWHVHPYFLGSDSMYAVSWLALLAGLVAARGAERRVPLRGSRNQREALRAAQSLGRREFLRGTVVAAGTFLLGMAATAVAGTSTWTQRTATLPSPSVSKRRRRQSDGGGTSSKALVKGTPIASLDAVPVGGAVGFTDPVSGDPAVLLRPLSNKVEAFSRICTHAGCPVQWDQADKLLICPCHGAEFDPAHGAEPIAGPAPSPLPRISVVIDPASGRVVVPS